MDTTATSEPVGVGPTTTTTTTTSGRERVAEDGSLTVFSKRCQRRLKKRHRSKPSGVYRNFLGLPFDILIHILGFVRPSDVFRLSRTCHALHAFILQDHSALTARTIIQRRYSCLEKCMRLPVLLTDVEDQDLRDLLQHTERQKKLDIHRRPYYQHVAPPDPGVICTCMTCILRWNLLCLAVDFSHWQSHLDKGEPLPIIQRGSQPKWNSELLSSHEAVVLKAVNPAVGGTASPLWYAAILEAHLASTVRALSRHSANKGNKRPRFRMTLEDMASGTDMFLERSGPPSADFPFNRDNYYMLEAYLPNRCWLKEKGRWGYMPAEQHNTDLDLIRRWASWWTRPVRAPDRIVVARGLGSTPVESGNPSQDSVAVLGS
ncbi:hypothetical protein KVR01_005351 [Diaporthe batatas]|uniref:uncharacterized protein n=1 Tax=Diaporthe batatas TaxID=748121 RepID=UPI001D05594F|nr:uncharacterized protein KVR01_005351 [Diaporthe batatas]KAG8165076.1 hypothetical protein KVR01_005351 [Diaporthe batatas]